MFIKGGSGTRISLSLHILLHTADIWAGMMGIWVLEFRGGVWWWWCWTDVGWTWAGGVR